MSTVARFESNARSTRPNSSQEFKELQVNVFRGECSVLRRLFEHSFKFLNSKKLSSGNLLEALFQRVADRVADRD